MKRKFSILFRISGWVVSFFFFFCPMTSQAIDLTVNAKDARVLVDASIAAHNLRKNQDWGSYGKMIIIDQLMKINPELKKAPDALVALVSAEWQKTASRNLTLYDQIVTTASNVASSATKTFPGIQGSIDGRLQEGVIKAITTKASAGLDNLSKYDNLSANELVRNINEGAQAFSETTADIDGSLKEIFDTYSSDLVGQNVLNKMFGKSWGTAIGQSHQVAISNNPDFKAIMGIVLPGEGGSGGLKLTTKGELKITLDTAKAKLKGTFTKIGHVIGCKAGEVCLENNLANDLRDLNKKYSNISNYVDNLTADDLSEALTKSQNYLTTLNGAQSSINFVSGIFSSIKGYEKFGRDIAVVGNAAVKVADGARRLLASPIGGSLLSGTLDFKKFGSELLTGNIIGMAADIFSVFGVAGSPSPDEEILKGISELKQDIADLRENMNDRFDHVDYQLTEINNKLDLQFDYLKESFEDLNLNIYNIQTSLDSIQDELYSQKMLVTDVRRDILRSIAEVKFSEFTTLANKSLGYTEKNNLPLSVGDFFDKDSDFFTWAQDISRLNLFAGVDNTSVDGKDLKYILSESVPWTTQYSTMCETQFGNDKSRCRLDTNLSYLFYFAKVNFNMPTPTTAGEKRLASIGIWSTAAEAYLRFVNENPWYLLNQGPDYFTLNAIYKTGCELRRAMQSLSTLPPLPNVPSVSQECGQIPSRAGIFESLVNGSNGFYDNAVTNLFSALASEQNTFVNGDATHGIPAHPELQGVDIFGPVTQATDSKPIIEMDFNFPQYPYKRIKAQASITDNLPTAFRLAWQLKQNKLHPNDDTLEQFGAKPQQISGPRYYDVDCTQDCIVETDICSYDPINDNYYDCHTTKIKSRKYRYSLFMYRIYYGLTHIANVETSSDGIFAATTYIDSYDDGTENEYTTYERNLPDSVSMIGDNWSAGQNLQNKKLDSATYANGQLIKKDLTVTYGNDEQVKKDLAKTFISYRNELYEIDKDTGVAKGEISKSQLVQDAVTQLDGFKLLLQDYIAVGLPRSLSEDDYLRALVYGDQSIFDGQGILQVFNSAIKQPDLQPKFDQVKERSASLHSVLEGILTSIQNGKFIEAYPSVDVTLGKLGLRLKTAEALAANDIFETPINTPLKIDTERAQECGDFRMYPACANDPNLNMACENLGVKSNDILQRTAKVDCKLYLPVDVVLGDSPKNGQLSDFNKETGSFTYTPDDGYAGSDSFTYHLKNKELLKTSNEATVTIHVLKPGDLNGDGKINITDVNMVKDMMTRNIYDPRADFYNDKNDKVINILDARKLVLKCEKTNCAL